MTLGDKLFWWGEAFCAGCPTVVHILGGWEGVVIPAQVFGLGLLGASAVLWRKERRAMKVARAFRHAAAVDEERAKIAALRRLHGLPPPDWSEYP